MWFHTAKKTTVHNRSTMQTDDNKIGTKACWGFDVQNASKRGKFRGWGMIECEWYRRQEKRGNRRLLSDRYVWLFMATTTGWSPSSYENESLYNPQLARDIRTSNCKPVVVAKITIVVRNDKKINLHNVRTRMGGRAPQPMKTKNGGRM